MNVIFYIMEIQVVFSMGIYLLVTVLFVFIIKTGVDTLLLNKIGEKYYGTLKQKLKNEQEKHQIYEGHILLINQLNSSLLNRMFQITKDLILVQKMIFGQRFN